MTCIAHWFDIDCGSNTGQPNWLAVFMPGREEVLVTVEVTVAVCQLVVLLALLDGADQTDQAPSPDGYTVTVIHCVLVLLTVMVSPSQFFHGSVAVEVAGTEWRVVVVVVLDDSHSAH